MINAVGREIPEQIGNYKVRPYTGAYAGEAPTTPIHTLRCAGKSTSDTQKLASSLEEAIKRVGLKDGMTISFHHSFREGDMIIGQVLTAIKNLGIKHLKFAPSAVVNIKNPSIVDFVKDGTIDRIEASGIRGELGDAVLQGLMDTPVILRPLSQGCSRSICAIWRNCSSGVHLTPSLGVLVQPYNSSMRYSTPS